METKHLVRRIRLVMSVINVSVLALRQQNGDDDADIADVLQRYGADRLDMIIDELDPTRSDDGTQADPET